MFNKVAALGIIAAYFVVMYFASNAAVGFIDQYLPHDWQDRLTIGLLVVIVFYLLDKVQKLDASVRSLTVGVADLRKRLGRLNPTLVIWLIIIVAVIAGSETVGA